MTKEKILITSALPYVNGIPHLGGTDVHAAQPDQ